MNGTLTNQRAKSKRMSRMKPSGSKLNFGEATDDVHMCIMCLRAIMNHQVEFECNFHLQFFNTRKLHPVLSCYI